MVRKANQLKQWCIRFSAQPGAFYLVPPQGKKQQEDWFGQWCEIDSSESVDLASQRPSYNRVFKSEVATAHHIERLLYAIDNHETMLTAFQLELFIHSQAKYNKTSTLSAMDISFLVELLKELNDGSTS